MSTIKVGTLLAADGSTTTQPSIPALDKRMAKAWVNWNGTGTVAIRDSLGVSSISDGGTGIYTVNFSTAFSNTNYVITWYNNCYANAGNSGAFGNHYGGAVFAVATGSVGLSSATSGYTDSHQAHAVFFGT
jgi:hypothetical protein